MEAMAADSHFLLDTDQIYCYAESGSRIGCTGSGQDASLMKICSPQKTKRFNVFETVVEDAFTGAVWTKDVNPAGFPLSWDEANAFVLKMSTRNHYGYSDWQLPTRNLLFSMVSHQRINPALPQGHPFKNVFPGYYWSSETCCRLKDQSWYAHLGGGRVHWGMKHGSYLVWPAVQVRKGLPDFGDMNRNRFVAKEDIVFDTHTSLKWSRNANPLSRQMTWQDALSSIRTYNSALAGRYDDWRMPNIRELDSLVDLDSHSPALPVGHPFVNVQDFYWSSTTSVYEPRYAWTLYCKDGNIGVGFKPQTDFHLWPVRRDIPAA
jgi:hypothetical protein